MKLRNEKAKHEMKTRLRRLEGQVRGIQSMLDEDRDCREVVQQMASVRAAVQSANLFFIQEYITSCVENTDPGDTSANRRIMDEMVTLLSKVI
jgi:DNA-binding FrmR family transcriptional regulator